MLLFLFFLLTISVHRYIIKTVKDAAQTGRENKMEYMNFDRDRWYAVQETSDDEWGYGSYNFDEAVQMLKAQGHGLIAVIDEENNYCEKEITYEEIEE